MIPRPTSSTEYALNAAVQPHERLSRNLPFVHRRYASMWYVWTEVRSLSQETYSRTKQTMGAWSRSRLKLHVAVLYQLDQP